jgi:hypothetical protein
MDMEREQQLRIAAKRMARDIRKIAFRNNITTRQLMEKVLNKFDKPQFDKR